MNRYILALIISFALLFPYGLDIFASPGNQSEIKDLGYYQQQGIAAYQRGDYSAFLENFKEALKLSPSNPRVIYNLACGYSLLGKKQEAFYWLNKFVESGLELNIEGDTDFDSIRDSEEFKEIVKKHKKVKTPVLTSKIACKVPEKDLIPEGIAFDPVTETLYLSSLYKSKIISVDKKGNKEDFTAERQDGLWCVLGMKVDAKRRILWAISSVEPLMRSYKKEEAGQSGVFKYDLNTGRLIKKYLLDNKSGNHLLNDLVINSDGDVFATDTSSSALYWISSKKDELELFLKTSNIINPNGIALSPDDKFLFVANAGGSGITVVEVSNKKLYSLSHPDNIMLFAIDGLYYYKDSLIAIQTPLNKVTRYYLNKGLDRIESAKVIEAHNPLFNNLTTGVLAGDHLYFIANSQFGSYNRDGSLFPMERLQEVIVMKADLSR
jgi:sugar lactone lactonase YvrE